MSIQRDGRPRSRITTRGQYRGPGGLGTGRIGDSMDSEGKTDTSPRDTADGAGHESVVLVDSDDNDVGTCEKLEAHRGDGLRHRAFSVFLLDAEGRQLLQQRAETKYHFGGLWTNACCSHPRLGETPADAARRRLVEELGIHGVDMVHAGSFEYRARDSESRLIEHEIDHVFVGTLDASGDGSRTRTIIEPNPDEVMAFRWVTRAELDGELGASPERFTPWFPIALKHARGLRPDAL
ncbi:MAG: isopentenyl-diphosphate Delta-isomerase [Planctomycetota bacterium]